MPAFVIRSLRGQFEDTRHEVHLAVVGPGGQLLTGSGDPERLVLIRSCAKPFQALPFVESGAMERLGLGSRELALACASHGGSPRHVAVAARTLSRAGLGPGDLRCGAHPPSSAEDARALARSGREPEPLHNNCSGKHAGMLAATVAMDLSTAGYELPEHPLQRRIRARVAELSELPLPPFAVDGCGVPTFVLPLRAVALLYARLAEPGLAPAPRREALREIAAAMRAHPDLVAGDGALDTVLMQALPGVVAKRGAAGVYALGASTSPLGPVGVALKVLDGNVEARSVAVVAVLDALGIALPEDRALDRFRKPVRRNHRGLEVGRWEVELALESFEAEPMRQMAARSAMRES